MNNTIIKILKENPSLLLQYILEYNNKLELNPNELIVLLYICLYNNTYKTKLSYKIITQKLNIEEENIGEIIKQLLIKKIIGIKTEKCNNKILEEYDINPLFTKLFDNDITTPNKNMNEYVREIEKEFSRILSPIEIDFINNNIIDKFTFDELKVSLKEMSLSGVRNLKYLYKVLENKKYYKKLLNDKSSDEIQTFIDWDEILDERKN